MRGYTIALFVKDDRENVMKFYWNIEPKQELIDQLRMNSIDEEYDEAVENANAILDMKVYSSINKATKIKGFKEQEDDIQSRN